MTSPQTELKELIKHSQLIQKRMAELTEIFEQNMAMIAALTNGFSAEAAAAANGNIPLTVAEQSIASAVATLAAQGVHIIPRQWLAVVARCSPKSSLYRTALAGLLKRRMLVAIPSPRGGQGSVKATDTLAAVADAPIDWWELTRRFATQVKVQESKLVCELLIAANDGVAAMDRKTLAEKTEQSVQSSSFRQRLTQLQADGFIEYGPDSTVRANIDWFMDRGAQ